MHFIHCVRLCIAIKCRSSREIFRRILRGHNQQSDWVWLALLPALRSFEHRETICTHGYAEWYVYNYKRNHLASKMWTKWNITSTKNHFAPLASTNHCKFANSTQIHARTHTQTGTTHTNYLLHFVLLLGQSFLFFFGDCKNARFSHAKVAWTRANEPSYNGSKGKEWEQQPNTRAWRTMFPLHWVIAAQIFCTDHGTIEILCTVLPSVGSPLPLSLSVPEVCRCPLAFPLTFWLTCAVRSFSPATQHPLVRRTTFLSRMTYDK